MASAIEEKRVFPRIDFHSPIRFQIRGTQEMKATTTRNISANGINFTDAQFIAPDTAVMLEINLLNTILKPVGRVCWSYPLPHSDRYHVGIQFVEFSAGEQNTLTDYINMHTEIS